MRILTLSEQEFKQLIRLAIPLTLALLVEIGIDLIDTVMAGWLSPTTLAAKALAGSTYITIIVIGASLFNSIGITISHQYGAKDYAAISITFQQGTYLTLAFTLPAMIIVGLLPTFFLLIKQDPQVVKLAADYLHTLMWGFPAIMFFLLLRELVAASDKARIITYITLVALPLNAILNYILMYGKLGLPALHIAGIGIASAIVSWLIFLALLTYVLCQPTLKRHLLQRWQSLHWPTLKALWKIGYPMSLMSTFEIGLFSLTSIIMGYIGIVALAAHQIVIQIVAVGFMAYLGISQALAIKVAHAMGSANPRLAWRFGLSAIILSMGFASINALIFWLFPSELTSLFSNTPNVENAQLLQYTTTFFLIATIFQFFDALQVNCIGALRGMLDTFVPMLLGLGSYWLVGLGSCYLFSFQWGLGGAGLWWGLCLGIAVSGIILFWRFHQQIQFNIIKTAVP